MVNNTGAYKIVSELLSGVLDTHPNYDMLIHKPSLYIYIPRSSYEDAKINGIRANDKKIINAYFTRIPESLKKYSEFLKFNFPVKIQCSKLEKIKDQNIKIYPVNIQTDKKIFSVDDVLKISKENNFFYDYFNRGAELDKIPHIALWVESGILPSFVVKFLIKKEK